MLKILGREIYYEKRGGLSLDYILYLQTAISDYKETQACKVTCRSRPPISRRFAMLHRQASPPSLITLR
ncbi:unnamed protein product [Fusarium fujikuroi]|uniref:Uncharacterized protein n=1 Tax=Fusarium fujikuroi TaxID=5127 RepID=A0A2H3RQI9_FUSFU|nr:uncharacterized protein FFC1_06740 [Fusarium fujikuroi]VTT56629.1 unnamed protein product [Fusarium fujikuroi]VZH98947.1 unnamed protein product [Fusarium fujikuroi]